MIGQAPRFWWHAEITPAARLLRPAASLYGAVAAARMRRNGPRIGVPVVCVGNFVVGGAGKTPVAIAIAQALTARGERPAVLSRGYGRQPGSSAVLRVDPDRHSAGEAGDEPLLLARHAPTFVASDRRAAAEAAVAANASALVLDDGLQSPALFKDASIAVVDGAVGVGNGLCLPAGPLRAPLNEQWQAVSALCVVGDGTAGSDLVRQASERGLPVLRAALRADPALLASLQGRRLFAFCGIGRPEKFFRTLDDSGLLIVGRRAFPDHHGFGEKDRKALLAKAQALGAELVTTEKDWVRLPAGFPAVALPVSLVFADKSPLDRLLSGLLAARVSAPK